MKCRRALLVTSATLMLATPLAFGGAPKQAAVQADGEQPTIAELMKQIKQLRKRVAELEKRVADLERHEPEFHADKHGVLYDAEGAPVGYWGVDVDRTGKRSR